MAPSRPGGPGRPPLTLRRPRATLAAAAAAVLLLGVLGLGVEGRLSPTSLSVPGTDSAAGSALLRSHFGESAPFAVLLRGPRRALDRQGPRLIRALQEKPGVTTLSPWDGARLARLRPAPRRALLLVDFHLSTAAAVETAVPDLEAALDRQVHAPVRATQTGYATLSRAIQTESIDATERAELIALPLLLLVLLLVFRSPLAAAIPLAFGAIVVAAARGLLFLAAGRISIDAFSLTVATMMGLALGVDYALLMVSRFREELAAGKAPREAAWATRASAGRTTLFAGSTLFASMLVSVFVLPGSLLLSLAATAILVTALSVATAVLLLPPLLSLLGTRLERRRGRGGEGASHRTLHSLLQTALRRPAPVAVAVGAALLLLAAPALALRTGPPSARQLPSSSPARQDAELLARQIGPGWDAPFLLLAATEHGPITAPPTLRRLVAFQRLLAAQPGVRAVFGPGQLARRSAPLAERASSLLGAGGARSLARYRALGHGLRRAEAGVGALRGGVAEAAQGAGLLGAGSGRAEAGATQIAAALDHAATGGERAGGAIGRLAAGAAHLADGSRSAGALAESLALGLHDLLPQLRGGPLARARRIRAALAAQAASGDPSQQRLARQAAALVTELAAARDELRSLRGEASRVNSALGRVAGGGTRLASGAERLNEAAARLAPGLQRLAGGSSALAGGLSRLQGGSEALAAGLSAGYGRSAPLQGGLSSAAERVDASGDSLAAQRDRLRTASPHLFDSGYFLLSALDGAPGAAREQAAQAIDLERGGGAAQVLVVSRYGLDSAASAALDRRLGRLAAGFAERSGLRVGVAGGAAQLADYNRVTRARVPLVVGAMTLVTFLALVLVLRALLLAALAVVLNLLTVGVAFGVLVLLFGVPAGWPLGGHDYVDAIGAAAIFGIVFGLSVDYAVFLLARIREAYDNPATIASAMDGDATDFRDRTSSRETELGKDAGSEGRGVHTEVHDPTLATEDTAQRSVSRHQAAIAFGLNRTAGVITGAAAIMIAVFACFAAAPLATVSQLGIGLAVAVALDATVVRILLLPALMLLIGERVWWLPAPLERLLPRLRLSHA